MEAVGEMGKELTGGEKIYQTEQKLIGPAGDTVAKFINKMPKDWVIKSARNRKGSKYVNPKNSGDYIRFSAENSDIRYESTIRTTSILL